MAVPLFRTSFELDAIVWYQSFALESIRQNLFFLRDNLFPLVCGQSAPRIVIRIDIL